MGRTFLIRIDIERLRQQLSRSDRADYTVADVRQWLIDAGIRPAPAGQGAGDRWVADEVDLGHLDPSEVLEADVLPNS